MPRRRIIPCNLRAPRRSSIRRDRQYGSSVRRNLPIQIVALQFDTDARLAFAVDLFLLLPTAVVVVAGADLFPAESRVYAAQIRLQSRAMRAQTYLGPNA